MCVETQCLRLIQRGWSG